MAKFDPLRPDVGVAAESTYLTPQPQPPTEEDLGQWEHGILAANEKGEQYWDGPALRLIAEVRRLRPMLQDAEEKHALGVAELGRLRPFAEQTATYPCICRMTAPAKCASCRATAALEGRSDG